jgi:hypothetical protein
MQKVKNRFGLLPFLGVNIGALGANNNKLY